MISVVKNSEMSSWHYFSVLKKWSVKQECQLCTASQTSVVLPKRCKSWKTFTTQNLSVELSAELLLTYFTIHNKINFQVGVRFWSCSCHIPPTQWWIVEVRGSWIQTCQTDPRTCLSLCSPSPRPRSSCVWRSLPGRCRQSVPVWGPTLCPTWGGRSAFRSSWSDGHQQPSVTQATASTSAAPASCSRCPCPPGTRSVPGEGGWRWRGGRRARMSRSQSWSVCKVPGTRTWRRAVPADKSVKSQEQEAGEILAGQG